DPREVAEIALGLREVDQLYHGCSGKHAGMLATCVHREYQLASYTAPEHPVQREILGVMAAFHHLPEGAIAVGVDGCGVPTFAMPLASIARAFATLAAPPPGPYGEAAGRVLDAMVAHPFMVAGTGRLCTDLMGLASGRVAAKIGAEGLLCLALRERGWGVAIKVEDGNPRGLACIAAALLAQLGILDEAAIARFAAL